eukprot:UN12310
MGNNTSEKHDIHQNENNDHHSNQSKQNGFMSNVYNGIKNYFSGNDNYNNEKHPNKPTHNSYRYEYAKKRFRGAVFIQLPYAMDQFSNQGLQWVEETMIYDDEGDGYHIILGPFK